MKIIGAHHGGITPDHISMYSGPLFKEGVIHMQFRFVTGNVENSDSSSAASRYHRSNKTPLVVVSL
jgi:hypothetical protein